MQRMYARQRQSKVEGEHSKDTTLAAVLISWFTAQVIYRGWRLLQLLSWDGLAEENCNVQSNGNMTDVPCFYVNPPEVSVPSLPYVGSRASISSADCAGVALGMWACRERK